MEADPLRLPAAALTVDLAEAVPVQARSVRGADRAADQADGVAQPMLPHAAAGADVDQAHRLAAAVLDLPLSRGVDVDPPMALLQVPQHRHGQLEAILLLVADPGEIRQLHVADLHRREAEVAAFVVP